MSSDEVWDNHCVTSWESLLDNPQQPKVILAFPAVWVVETGNSFIDPYIWISRGVTFGAYMGIPNIMRSRKIQGTGKFNKKINFTFCHQRQK